MFFPVPPREEPDPQAGPVAKPKRDPSNPHNFPGFLLGQGAALGLIIGGVAIVALNVIRINSGERFYPRMLAFGFAALGIGPAGLLFPRALWHYVSRRSRTGSEAGDGRPADNPHRVGAAVIVALGLVGATVGLYALYDPRGVAAWFR